MLSQIGYLGAMVAPNNQQFKAFESIIYDFVKGSINVAKDHITLSSWDRGLGMINIRDYVTGLQASWLKKIRGGISDNWRRDLRVMTGGNPLLANANTFANLGSPVLTGICKEYEVFKRVFTKVENNKLESSVINNPILARWETNGTVKTILYRNAPPITIKLAATLKVKDLWHENGMRRIDEINDVTGLPMNLVTYMRLNTILGQACARLAQNSKPQSIENFFNSFKKGQKVFGMCCITIGKKGY
jgi:hypothetical protein